MRPARSGPDPAGFSRKLLVVPFDSQGKAKTEKQIQSNIGGGGGTSPLALRLEPTSLRK